MPSWQTFVRLAYEVADEKGAQFEGIEEGGAFISDLSRVWSENKQQIKQMTERQAKDLLYELVEP